jgi:Mg-chelatase subunit ChlD
VSLGKGAPNNILIILDSSSSMSEPFDGAVKIDTAKQVLSEVVDLLPENALVGLRIFGGCETSRLLVPLAQPDRASLRAEINAVDTGGPTPIAFALEQAKEDFADTTDGKMILLVSDGAETCKGDPVKKAQELIDLGYDLKINVVGFDVAFQEWARDQLMTIADVTGGRYFDAESSEELRTALQLSIPILYHIYNSQGKEVYSGSIGYEEVQLPPDNYRVVIDTRPPLVIDGVSVYPNRMTTIKIEPTDGGYSVQLQ